MIEINKIAWSRETNLVDSIHKRLKETDSEHMKTLKEIVENVFAISNIEFNRDTFLKVLITLTIEQTIEVSKNYDIATKKIDLKKHECIKKIMKKVYEDTLGSSSKLERDRFVFFEKMGINVCPYCNRNYIDLRVRENDTDSANKQEFISAQLDHIYPKTTYPILAVTLNNLLPSCAKCNHLLGTKETTINPYHVKDYHLEFLLNTSMSKGFIIVVKDKNLYSKLNDMGVLYQYRMHLDFIKDIRDRFEIYNKFKKNEIGDLFMVLQGDLSWEEIILGKQYSTNDYLSIPLSKMKTEIIKQLLSSDNYSKEKIKIEAYLRYLKKVNKETTIYTIDE